MSIPEFESDVTTDGHPASLSWNKAPFWGLRPDLYYCLTVASLLIWGALSDERTDLSLQLLLALARTVIFWSESRRTCDNILLSQIRDFPFRRLLRLAGSRWRYSTPPPHGLRPLLVNSLPEVGSGRTVWGALPSTVELSRSSMLLCFGGSLSWISAFTLRVSKL
jgi:hypothetical protein